MHLLYGSAQFLSSLLSRRPGTFGVATDNLLVERYKMANGSVDNVSKVRLYLAIVGESSSSTACATHL